MAKTYTLESTKNPRLFRVMDRMGNWQHYFFDQSEKNDQSVGVYLRGVTTILERGYAKGAFFEEWLLGITREKRDEILKNAGEKGDKVHRFIDLALTTSGLTEFGTKFTREVAIYSRDKKQEEPLTDAEWYCILAWAHFWAVHDITLFVSEAPFYSLKGGWAGTGDALGIPNKCCGVSTCPCAGIIGKLGYFDWKSSKGLRPSYSAQGATYIKADNLKEFTGGKEVEFVGLVRIGTDHEKTKGYEFKVFLGDRLHKQAVKKEKDPKKKFKLENMSVKKAYGRFLAAKAIDDFEYKPFDPAIDIQDIPDEVEIVVRRIPPLVIMNATTIIDSEMLPGKIISTNEVSNEGHIHEELIKAPKRARKASNGKAKRNRKGTEVEAKA